MLLGLGACSPAPFKTSIPAGFDPAILKSGKDVPTAKALSYCYSSQLNQSQQVIARAQEDCSDGRLHFHDEDMLWTRCPLIQPVRITFICYPAKPAETVPESTAGSPQPALQ